MVLTLYKYISISLCVPAACQAVVVKGKVFTYLDICMKLDLLLYICIDLALHPGTSRPFAIFMQIDLQHDNSTGPPGTIGNPGRSLSN